MTLEPEKDRGGTVNRLYSGERICTADYYLISRHDGKGFYKDDWGRMVPCGMFPDYSDKDAPPLKHMYSKATQKESA